MPSDRWTGVYIPDRGSKPPSDWLGLDPKVAEREWNRPSSGFMTGVYYPPGQRPPTNPAPSGGGFGGLSPANGGQFQNAQVVQAALAQIASRGAQQRANRAQQAASTAASAAAGQALAGGGFGSSRAALLGMANMRAQGAAQGVLAGDQMIESDLNRQQGVNNLNAELGTNTNQFNAGQSNSWNQSGADRDLQAKLQAERIAAERAMRDQELALERERLNWQKTQAGPVQVGPNKYQNPDGSTTTYASGRPRADGGGGGSGSQYPKPVFHQGTGIGSNRGGWYLDYGPGKGTTPIGNPWNPKDRTGDIVGKYF